MCINAYRNFGDVIVLGRHVDTEKKTLLAKCHEMVRILMIMIIITTDEALHHMPGSFRAKYLKYVIVCIIRITSLIDIINPIY